MPQHNRLECPGCVPLTVLLPPLLVSAAPPLSGAAWLQPSQPSCAHCRGKKVYTNSSSSSSKFNCKVVASVLQSTHGKQQCASYTGRIPQDCQSIIHPMSTQLSPNKHSTFKKSLTVLLPVPPCVLPRVGPVCMQPLQTPSSAAAPPSCPAHVACCSSCKNKQKANVQHSCS